MGGIVTDVDGTMGIILSGLVLSFWVKSPAKLPQPSKKKVNVGRIARKEEEEEEEGRGNGWCGEMI